MKNQTLYTSMLKLGTFSVVVAGCCYFLIAICALFSPKPIASYVASSTYFEDFRSYEPYFIFLKYLMLLGNISLIGFIVSVFHWKNRPSHAGFVLLTILAIVGLGIGMLQSISDATTIPHLAKVYDNASEILQHVIIAFGVATPAIYILSIGLPGIWLIVFNITFRKKFSLPLFLSGLAWGLGCILTVFAHLFVVLPLIYLIAWGALLGVPIWTFCQSRYMLSEYRKSL